MYTAVKGIYENGVLKFTETPPSVEKSEVVILFMDKQEESEFPGKKPKPGVVLGSLANKGLKIPDDFNNPLDDLNDYI
ncbi:hypothetical protein MUK70_23900 [Dyadobacter chenwenxiniae]|uniref:DUF2281 domain-containing protein n=1 Tax=Dyadobacter chenwenxiniae TaxID=2906456 RepID=A0A9X1TIH2_9BACT|nr:hypothetical protein [Dyadobacter chenwenxiniae]MCF0065514.1 hypothetical protein [Dyadobacter chenwenxiniae]UON82079.1 hypothetical protein MUK70_23900 [Dyadobacter chenwenxiniae]